MTNIIKKPHKFVVLVFVTIAHVMTVELFIESAIAQQTPGVSFEGEYSGKIFLEEDTEAIDANLRVTDLGDNEYEGILYYGNLTDELNDPDGFGNYDEIELRGTYKDFILRLEGEGFPLRFQFILGRFTALDEQNNYMGHLDRVIRVSS